MNQTRIAELADLIVAKEKQLAEQRAELEALKKAGAEAEIKVGDLVISIMSTALLPLGEVFTVRAVEPRENGDTFVDVYLTWEGKRLLFSYCRSFFRRADYVADRAAIEKYLLAEAAREGFKVGKMVKSPGTWGKITSLHVVFPGDPYESSSCSVLEEQRKGKPFVAAKYSVFVAPISGLILVTTPVITVTVDGVIYAADFDKNAGLVTFGCAVLDPIDLRLAFKLVEESRIRSERVNRSIEAVKIGKGLFDEATLKAIVEELDRRSAK